MQHVAMRRIGPCLMDVQTRRGISGAARLRFRRPSACVDKIAGVVPVHSALADDGLRLGSNPRNPPSINHLDPLLTAEGGQCLHASSFACARDDYSLRDALHADVLRTGPALGWHRSGKHLVVYGEALRHSMPFKSLLEHVLRAFNVTLVDCWVNVYRGKNDAKNWHYDNYWDRSPTPTVTLGVSLGDARDIAFRHVESGKIINVKSENGDVVAFDQQFNSRFMHGIPLPHEPANSKPSAGESSGLRLSVIVWANRVAPTPSMTMTRKWTPGWREGVPLTVSWKDWGLPVATEVARGCASHKGGECGGDGGN
eukprot:TRINITY_DN9994_c0_g1_i1.p1 TRINITY_DN9994_c0_g1~~TRINITY_DN9994_c0_g1_i1.p1  ORF type:complete len:312 (-),score=42.83 TRINITY_DN9994_c0_g1_i1:419-1354(-)